jgi:hypothetical protein
VSSTGAFGGYTERDEPAALTPLAAIKTCKNRMTSI